MYPEKPELDFECGCPIKDRKNVWNDITGVHVRFCPICATRVEQYYEPAGEPAHDHIRVAKAKADIERRANGVGVRPVKRPA